MKAQLLLTMVDSCALTQKLWHYHTPNSEASAKLYPENQFYEPWISSRCFSKPLLIEFKSRAHAKAF